MDCLLTWKKFSKKIILNILSTADNQTDRPVELHVVFLFCDSMTFEIVDDQERLDIGIHSSSISHIIVMKVLFM